MTFRLKFLKNIPIFHESGIQYRWVDIGNTWDDVGYKWVDHGLFSD